MNEHSKAQSLIQSGTKITPQERVWLRSHLETCHDCRAYAAMQKELLAELPLVYAAAPLSRNEVDDRQERIQDRMSGSAKLTGLFNLSRGLIFVAGALAFVVILLVVVPGLLPDPAPLPLTDATQTLVPVTATPSNTPETQAVIAPTAVPTEAPMLPLSSSPFESINQLGGSMRGIVLHGDTAFVGMGPRLAAVDLTDPASPQLMGLSPSFPGMVNALVPHPDAPYTLFAAAGKRLVTLDVSDPAHIVPLHALELPGSILSLALDADNDILYATGETTSQPSRTRSYVVSVRVGADGALELLDRENLGNQITALAVGPGVLYLGADQTSVGVYAMPLAQPGELSTPRGVIGSSPEVYRAGYRLHATYDRLYVGSYDGLFAYDIRDPFNPVELEKIPAMMVEDFAFDGQRVYVYGWVPAGTFLPFQTAVVLAEAYRGPALSINSSDVALHRGRMIVSHYQLGVFDVQLGVESELVVALRSPVDSVLGAASDEEQVYVVSEEMWGVAGDFTLQVLRLPDLLPLSESTIPNPDRWGGADWFRGVTLEGGRLYVAGMDGVTIYDTSTSAPHSTGVPASWGHGSVPASPGDCGGRAGWAATAVHRPFQLRRFDHPDRLRPYKPGLSSAGWAATGTAWRVNWAHARRARRRAPVLLGHDRLRQLL
jgi:hypothetical protein